MNRDELDEKMQKGYEVIEKAISNNIPMMRKQIKRKTITSTRLRLSQHLYHQLTLESTTHGWRAYYFFLYKMIRNLLKNESESIYRRNWEEIIERTARNYTIPKDSGLK